MAPIPTILFCVRHVVPLNLQEITRREKLLCANKGTFPAMRDPRLYSCKLRYCSEATQNGGRRLEGTKSEGEGLGGAHFV